MSEITSVLLSAGIAFAAALTTLWVAKRAGLTDVQREVRLESDRLIQQLKARISLLESERAEDKALIVELRRENTVLTQRVDRLEKVIADRAIG